MIPMPTPMGSMSIADIVTCSSSKVTTEFSHSGVISADDAGMARAPGRAFINPPYQV
jgi:hypothetical protein